MRVGVLDDNPAICEMLKDMLELVGHSTYVYQDTDAFLASVFLASATSASPSFDLMIVDLHLPGSLSGVQVIKQVRTMYPDIPALLISASSFAEIEAAMQGLSEVKVLQKPLRLANLLASIELVKHPV